VYGATDPTLTYSISGFVNGDTEASLDSAVSITRAAGEAVGTYAITPSGAADGNYSVSFVSSEFSIAPAGLTVTADAGQSKVYGAIDPTLTYSISGFVNGDTEASLDSAVSITRAAGETVGTYAITPSGAADTNYSVSFVSSEFSIAPAGLTVTADSGQSKVYGAADPTLTYSISGFVNGDTEASLDSAVSITRAAGETVGDYAITPSGAADGNYTISFLTAEFSITALVDLEVSIDVLNGTLVAGGDALDAFRVSVTNHGPSDASGVELLMTSVLPLDVTFPKSMATDGVFASGSWDIGFVPAGHSATLTFSVQAGADTVRGTDVVPLAFELAAVNEPQSSTADDAASGALSVISFEATPQSVAVTATIEQQSGPFSGLYIAKVTVTDEKSEALPSFRLYVNDLPEDVQVYNASGTRMYGVPALELPYLFYDGSAEGASSVTLIVVLFRATVNGDFTPVYDVELLTPAETMPDATSGGINVTLTKVLSNGDILIELASLPGHEYAVEYSEDLTVWSRVFQSISASADRLQWIDDGPPKTAVRPSQVRQRFYRLIDITAEVDE
jgi:hypothetical protein